MHRLLADESGQDLVEYMLLTSAVSLAGVAAMMAIGTAINTVYQTWDASTQAIWQPQAPAGS
jgi:Flp pilus assembly pilin Flp